jgi:hypothetical protein
MFIIHLNPLCVFLSLSKGLVVFTWTLDPLNPRILPLFSLGPLTPWILESYFYILPTRPRIFRRSKNICTESVSGFTFDCGELTHVIGTSRTL